jgi:hypothetical protein
MSYEQNSYGIQYSLFEDPKKRTEPDLDSLEASDSLMAVAVEEIVKNGNLNKVRDEDASIHNWYRFVLSYPPHLVREYVNRFDLTPDRSFEAQQLA